MEVGEVYFNKSDEKKLGIMNERSNKETWLIETIDLQEGAFLAENQRQLSYIGSRKIFYDYR